MSAEPYFGFWSTLGYRCLRVFVGALFARPYLRVSATGRERLPPAPFILPRRLAEIDPFVELEDPVGSGPFRAEAAPQAPPSLVARYRRHPDYVAREEPASGEES